MTIVTPEGMKQVSKEEFFDALYADKRDIMPSIAESDKYSVWMTTSRYVWGYSYPGWKNPQDEKAYFIRK